MELSRTTIRRGGVVGALAALGPLAGASAWAVVTGFSGTAMTSMQAVTSTDASFTQGPAWVSLPNAKLGLHVPDRSTLRARFSGESLCANVDAAGLNFCRTRIVLVAPTGALVEFHPQSNLDYRFDNTFDGRTEEAHAMERLLQVPKGDWTVLVQYNTTSPGTRLVLDDWTFTVDAIAA